MIDRVTKKMYIDPQSIEKGGNHMKRKINFKLVILGLFLVYLVAITKYALADVFSISYSLTEGGYQLELTPQNQYKGVDIEVLSDVATRYEVIQKVLMPLESRENPGVTLRDNLTIRGIRYSSKGVFHIPTNDMPVRADEIFYTSNAAGDTDTFTIVYGLVNIENIQPGHYYGRLSFTLQPIGSVRQSETKFLDVYVTIGQEGSVKPIIEITTPSGGNTITLNSRKEEAQRADVLLKINGVFKSPFNITQVITRPFESQDGSGSRFNYDAVNFVVQGAEKGTAPSQIAPLSLNSQTIYTSAPNGDADNSLIITYGLGDLSQLKAGRYSTNIQYFLEGTNTAKQPQAMLKLEVENERTFDLIVTPQDEKGMIEFRNLKPEEGPKISEVMLEVKTNIGKQYQVNQNVYSELVDREGTSIPNKYFTLKTDSLDTKGTLKFPQEAEVKKGETILFISDELGSSDKFKVIYELVPPPDMKAGTYSSRITYALSEI